MFEFRNVLMSQMKLSVQLRPKGETNPHHKNLNDPEEGFSASGATVAVLVPRKRALLGDFHSFSESRQR